MNSVYITYEFVQLQITTTKTNSSLNRSELGCFVPQNVHGWVVQRWHVPQQYHQESSLPVFLPLSSCLLHHGQKVAEDLSSHLCAEKHGRGKRLVWKAGGRGLSPPGMTPHSGGRCSHPLLLSLLGCHVAIPSWGGGLRLDAGSAHPQHSHSGYVWGINLRIDFLLLRCTLFWY